MPDEVQDEFGYALHLAQTGQKHERAKPLKGQGSAGVLEVVENLKGDTYRAVYTVRFSNAVYVLHCFQKKATKGIATPKPDIELIESRLKIAENLRKRIDTMTEFERGSTNVYADLGYADADEMLIKAQLATKIGEIIKRRRLTQTAAAEIVGMSQPKLSAMLRGQFRGISETKMLNCLTRLGRDIKIVVGPAKKRPGEGHIEVLSA